MASFFNILDKDIILFNVQEILKPIAKFLVRYVPALMCQQQNSIHLFYQADFLSVYCLRHTIDNSVSLDQRFLLFL